MHVCKIISHTTFIMLERTMYLVIILLLVQYKKYRQKIKVNRQQVNKNVYVRISESLLCRKIYEFFETLIYLCTDLYFLCDYFFIPVCH